MIAHLLCAVVLAILMSVAAFPLPASTGFEAVEVDREVDQQNSTLAILAALPAKMNPFPVAIGNTADTFVVLRSVLDSAIVVNSAISMMGHFQVVTTFPEAVPPMGTVDIVIHTDASTAGACDVGVDYDTLMVVTNNAHLPVIKVPVMVTKTFVEATLQYESTHLDSTHATLTNQPLIEDFFHIGPCTDLGCPLIDGLRYATPMIGLIDGLDTTVYHSYGQNATHPFPIVDKGARRRQIGGYSSFAFRTATPDGRIHGEVKYFWDLANENRDAEYFIVDYRFYNNCDTTLNILTGLLSDFDLNVATGNYANFDINRKMMYAVDWLDSMAAGVVLLEGATPRYHSFNKEVVVSPYNGLPSGVSYGMLAEADNSAGTSIGNWLSMIGFGESALGATDTLHFRLAFVYSMQGVAGIQKIADNIFPVFDTLDLFVEPARIVEFHGENSVVNPPDSQLVLEYLGDGNVNWQATNSSSWLQLHQTSGTSSETLRFSYNAVGLTSGVHTDTIWIDAPDSKNQRFGAEVKLTVIPGTGAINVPADQPTIQSAINVAVTGERILVAPGIYYENLDFLGKRIKVLSSDGAETTTLMSANENLPIVKFMNGEPEWTQFSGFEVTGPSIQSVVRIDGLALPTITNNVFHHLGAVGSDNRHVIENHFGQPLIANNVFHHNINCWVTLYSSYVPMRVIGNTFDHNGTAIVPHDNGVIKYNIVTNCAGRGIVIADALYTFGNIVWGNHQDFDEFDFDLPAQNPTFDPLFCNPVNGEYSVLPESPSLPDNNEWGVRLGADLGICSFVCGDPDHSSIVNISDAVYMIAFIFGGGPTPEPTISGDVDCSGAMSISDAVYLINFIFNSGAAPCQLCP